MRRETITRWRRFGVPIDAADRVADRLDCHPYAVWRDDYDAAAAAA